MKQAVYKIATSVRLTPTNADAEAAAAAPADGSFDIGRGSVENGRWRQSKPDDFRREEVTLSSQRAASWRVPARMGVVT